MKQNFTDKIVEELNTVYENIKAESLIIELQKAGAIEDEFVIHNKSSFKRGYRRDVLAQKQLDDSKLLLELSRDGIYDSLPEGVFHKNNENQNTSYNYKRQQKKKEEENSRLFFSPIENELFGQSIKVEKNEQKLLEDFYNTNNDFVLKFWNLDNHRNNKYILKMIKLLPHCHKISGDLNLIRLSLQKILNNEVQITKSFRNLDIKPKKGKEVLGVNTITKTPKLNVAVPFIEVGIGPVSIDYFKKNHEIIMDFLKIFYNYFLPLELQVETKFFSNDKEKLKLNKNNAPILGVSTRI
ncbi:MAG: hypothetical protein CR968_01795 [Flavobacteriia bacterium]|nr:MAG: hypothetical protein CR968_01795 [Flavobacteriia bacterium]